MCKVILENLTECANKNVSTSVSVQPYCEKHLNERLSIKFQGIQKARREALDLRNANEMQDAYAEECRRLGIADVNY